MSRLFFHSGHAFVLLILGLILAGCAVPPPPATSPTTEVTATTETDRILRQVLAQAGIGPLDPGPTPDPAKVELGRMLFFDKELSGNRDISCATCHHPTLGTGDNLSLSIGTGGFGLGPERRRGAMRMLIPRNAPELFNRGSPEWHTMFWDGRVIGTPYEGFTHPAEFTQTLPSGLDSLLAAQAMFPVTSRAEMRGEPKDLDVFGNENEVAASGEKDLQAVWRALMKRLLAIPEYRRLFAAAYPDIPMDELGFQHAANALAAFQIAAFTLLNSPWDRYLAGDDTALSAEAKQGALLFYGKARCSVCHSGNLLTDQAFHNIGVPQFGPGKGRQNPFVDLGRARETKRPEDRFAFRTPPLRNVALTGPWMHNGAYFTLADAVRHHLDPRRALAAYDYSQLAPEIRSELHLRPRGLMDEVAAGIDPILAEPIVLAETEFAQLLAFLEALTDPAAIQLEHHIPEAVPSGLPVHDGPDGPTLFRNVSAEAGIRAKHTQNFQMTGQAWGDYDNDGYLDLYVTDNIGPNTLYHNEGNGTFTVSPLSPQVALPDHKSGGATFADYDNDGWPDLLVLGREEDVLFRNDGGRGFVDVTAQAGISDPYHSKSASWADYDGDGWLDLYVANWSCLPRCARSTGSTGDPDRLYRNNGDGTFTDVSHLIASHTYGGGFIARWFDYDNDGDQDLYLVNDEYIQPAGNKLFRNDGPGCQGWCFTEIAAEVGADTELMGMGVAADDWDGDGDFDLYFTNAGKMVLLENQDGRFRDVAETAGVALSDRAVGWGVVSFDYDNDGDRDLYVALMKGTGTTAFNPLFRNDGRGRFEDVGRRSGADDPGAGMGVSAADYDWDGRVDLVLGNYNQDYRLFRNETPIPEGYHWLGLKLVGGGPVNRDAVGARVVVTTDDGRQQVQEVHNGTSLGGGDMLNLHFGLGRATVRRLEIRWPNGVTQVLDEVPVDRYLTVVYGNP
ncbi:MAG: FG-GAP-like repeat-containing protein [Caldilineales bacterium]|nr:FG-GAP-like repeat-containing protein [Caldilineales bacterium]